MTKLRRGLLLMMGVGSVFSLSPAASQHHFEENHDWVIIGEWCGGGCHTSDEWCCIVWED